MRNDHSIARLCQNLLVSPSGFYDWSRRRSAPGPRAAEDLALAEQIAAIHAESRQTYGAPRIALELRARGQRHGRNRIARLMKGRSLRGRQKGRHRVQTTDSHHDHPAMESFWSTLKLELVYRRPFDTRQQAQAEIFDFIELFYNRQRRHTSLAGLSPAHFELLNI